jgi:probable phosphoglycerate mutase
MLVYIMRHGYTEWNKLGKLQGSSDIELNEEGRELAVLTGKGMADIHFDVCYSSPLKRALETARLVLGDSDTPVIIDERLREMCFGEVEGLEKELQPPCVATFFEDPGNYVPPSGGESIEELRSRTADFIRSVLEPLSLEKPDANVLISGHGAMNKGGLIAYFREWGKEHFWDGPWQKNCCVCIVDVHGGQHEILEEGKIYY